MNGAESVSLSARGSSGVADDAARLWWVFVAIGSMWVIFGLLVFRIDATTALFPVAPGAPAGPSSG